MYFGEDDERDFSEFETLCELNNKGSKEYAHSSPVVPISLEKYHSLFQPWRGALLLKLLGKNVSFRILEHRTRNIWNLQQGCELIDLEQGFCMARFYSREDYFKVLEGGPWIILGHYLTVTKWKPNFRPSMEKVQSTLVWVRFSELPLELFDEEVLYAMRNTLGRIVRIDSTTLVAAQGKYTHVCVELDLSKSLVTSITILGCPQRVEYKGLLQICFNCGRYGHRVESCPIASAESEKTKP